MTTTTTKETVMSMHAEHRETIISNLVWDDRAVEVANYWGLGTTEVKAIIRHDPRPTMDPHASEVGYPIIRFQRGDIVVVVGFRIPDSPKVLHVHTITEMLGRGEERTHRGTVTSGPGTTLPTSHRDLKRRILDLGYRFEVAGNGHLAVIDKTTDRRIYAISSTPRSSRGIADDWKGFLRAHNVNQMRRDA